MNTNNGHNNNYDNNSNGNANNETNNSSGDGEDVLSNNENDVSFYYNAQNNDIPHIMQNVKLIGLNVCGLRSKLRNGIFEEFAIQYDILCLSETNLHNIDLSGTSLANYTCFIKEKSLNSHRYGGVHGLCMIVKNNIAEHAQIITEIQSPYILWVKFNKEAFGVACIIGSAYLPGENSIHKDKEMFDVITEDIFVLKNTYNLPICLIGDLNSRTGTLDDSFTIEPCIINNCGFEEFAHDLFDLNSNEDCQIYEKRYNRDTTINSNGELLVEFCKANNLKIVNGRCGADKELGDFTFNSPNGSSTIDYCIISPNFFSHILDFEVDVLDQNLSDFHSPIILTLKTDYENTQTNNTDQTIESDINYEPINSKWCSDKKLEFQSKFDLNKIEEANLLLDTFESEGSNQRDIDSIVKLISDISVKSGLETGISKCPQNKRNPHKLNKTNKPWFDQECHEKRKQFFRIKNRLKKSKSFHDKAALNNETKAYKKFINKKSHIYNKNLHKKLRDLKSSKPKEYWNLLNSKKHKPNNSISINTLYNHFKIINNHINETETEFDASKISEEGDEALNNEFTTSEVNNLINKLKNNKSNGIDNIINEFIKFSPMDYKLLLVRLFNTILKTGIIPSNWCISFISPIYKNKGSTSDPDNYRGISLISCLGKLFTALINERLNKFVNVNNILGEEQAGFRSGYSTQDHIFTLHTLIDLYLNKFGPKKILYCAFIDYRKAFDLVDRSSLWSKLLTYNINGRIMKLIYNIYQNTKACIKLNNSISASFKCNIGVRQGDNLSPLLFSLFINDFEKYISDKFNGLKSIENLFSDIVQNDEIVIYLKLYALLYADDTIILAESPFELQLALNAVYNYCEKWKLKINVDETIIIRFSKRRSPNMNYEFWLNNEKVEVVDTYIYLGTTFSYNGKFKDAIKKQTIQAQRALFAIKSKKDIYNLPVDILLDLFDKMILPILLYGCEIWGFENLDCIEIFYRTFLKYVLRLNKQTANCMVYGEAGRKPLGGTIKNGLFLVTKINYLSNY